MAAEQRALSSKLCHGFKRFKIKKHNLGLGMLSVIEGACSVCTKSCVYSLVPHKLEVVAHTYNSSILGVKRGHKVKVSLGYT